MPRTLKPWFILLLAGFIPAAIASVDPEGGLKKLSIPKLEKRLAEIDAELGQLARFSLRRGFGAIGYRSVAHNSGGSSEWVEVTFDRAYPIDEIVLVPSLWRKSHEGFQSDGFPHAFRVLAGNDNQPEGTVIATFDTSDHLLPRIAPLTISVHGISASWIRIEATKLSRRAFDKRYIFQLAELMVFSGPRNVALRRPVKASSEHLSDLVHAWGIQFLVDGHVPYLMDAAHGDPSLAYISSATDHPSLTLDLGREYPLSEIHLHAVDQSATVPQAYPGNLGIPEELLIEGATLADFSDAVPLLKLHLKNITDTGPLNMWPLPETACRFVRIRCPDPKTKTRFGFAEIALFSEGRDVALGKPIYTNVTARYPRRVLAAMTDGRTLYGSILPIREWMDQLSRRHDLETERPAIAAELNLRYARQQRILQIMSWLAALLAAAVGFTILIERMLRMRQAVRMRERFAADLHDELGANIHTIGLLGDLARDATSREEVLELLDRSREFTERSGTAIRNWSNMLEARGLCEDLVEEMKRSAATLLADFECDLSFEGTEFLQKLKPRKRIDLFFFYKECLTNILRHSGATRVDIRLNSTPKELTLSITDNGHGLNGEVPASLRRRARLLGAKVSAQGSTGGGTCITLKLKTFRFPLIQ